MKTTVIKNAILINEGIKIEADLRISGQHIEQISGEISASANDIVIDADGSWLLPGMIDDQVHLRGSLCEDGHAVRGRKSHDREDQVEK